MKHAVLSVVAVLAGCSGGGTRAVESPRPAVDVAAEREKLMQTSRDWAQLVARGDFEAALAVWADDAVVMVPGQSPIRGKAAIRAYVEGASKIPGFRITWEPLEAHVAASGDLAYLIERNEISVPDAAGNPMTEHNKVITVWRKQADGSWRNVVDMWNAAPPPK